MKRRTIIAAILGALMVALFATAAFAVVREGGPGNNKLYGTTGVDLLIGNGGHDSIYGERAADRLEGNRDNDLIVDGGFHESDKDRIFAGLGNDTVFANNQPGSKDSVDCGPGPKDSASVDRLDVVRANCEQVFKP